MNLSEFFDVISLKLCGATIFGGIILNIIPSGFIGLLTGMAAVSTIIYNSIKVYMEFKQKQK